MNNVKERETFIQSMLLLFLAMAKRYLGSWLGPYENVIFVFAIAILFYVIHFLFVICTPDYPKKADWDEKLNIVTIVFFGISIFGLQLMQVTNLFLLAAVGIILIAINVLIKTKRKAASETLEKQRKNDY